MSEAVFRPSLSAYRTPAEAAAPMTAAFARLSGSHEGLLAADASAIGDALLSAYGDTGLIDVRVLAGCLYAGPEPVPGFPADGAALSQARFVLCEGWATLVSRGYVARDLFAEGWFVTRAGNRAMPEAVPVGRRRR